MTKWRKTKKMQTKETKGKKRGKEGKGNYEKRPNKKRKKSTEMFTRRLQSKRRLERREEQATNTADYRRVSNYQNVPYKISQIMKNYQTDTH